MFSALIAFAGVALGKSYCQRGESCWPTLEDVNALKAKLNPEQPRILKWDGAPNPRVSSVPLFSPGDQPLYGLGVNGLDALYYDPDFDMSKQCYLTAEPETRPFCYAAARNNQLEDVTPGFVVFALTPLHVQLSVQFAKQHNLCIMVAGTGHDFINRHSCTDGMFIRTTLMKQQEWDLEDRKGFGWKDGNAKFGAGIVFSEAHKAAADRGRYVSSGWAITVGIAGWSLGGGHGPFAQNAGLGADNILEVDIVLANGTLITANERENSDLWWAVRGGGGSTWGIITAFTLRAHRVLDVGMTYASVEWSGDYCDVDTLDLLVDAYSTWAQSLDRRWSGLTFFTPSQDRGTLTCGGNWVVMMQYIFQGAEADALKDWNRLLAAITKAPTKNEIRQATTYWDIVSHYGLEPIIPWRWTPIGVVSVLVQRDRVASGELATLMKQQLRRCPTEGVCNRHEMYHDITGALDSPREKNTAISSSFRDAMFHYVFSNEEDKDTFYKLGAHSYLSESAVNMDDWQTRLWGDNYPELLRVKRKYDPESVFWCRHCVGDDAGDIPAKELYDDVRSTVGYGAHKIVPPIAERLNFAYTR